MADIEKSMDNLQVQDDEHSMTSSTITGGTIVQDGSSNRSSQDVEDQIVQKPKKTLGLCAKCKENIIGHENGCKALGALYHVNCFVCQKCRDPLVKKPFYHTDGLTYCEKDYLDTLEKCDVCEEHIKERILRAVDKQYHPECFKCTDCSTCLDGVPFTLDSENNVLCVQCYNKKFAFTCAACDKLIISEDGAETYRIIAMDKDFHVACYKCEVCDVKFTNDEGQGCYPHNDRLLCHTHYKEAVAQ